MLTSKEILERTGISRATLNNYIASGLLPRPQVLAPGPSDGTAPRIGYFPADAIERVETIQRLKREGWSISHIAERLAAGGGGDASGQSPATSGAVEFPRVPAAPAAAARGPATLPSPTSAPPVTRGAAEIRSAAAPAQIPRGGDRRKSPVLTPVTVLAATLQDAARLWLKLSPEEYFDLVNELWADLDVILRRHHGVSGPHPGEGLVCYFLPQPQGSHSWHALLAAHEFRSSLRAASQRWQARKSWDVHLCMNIGVDEGEEWMGALGASGVRVLGESVERAEQLSRCGRMGSVFVTRNLVGKLAPADRARLIFGVPRPDSAADEPVVLFSFTRLAELALPAAVPARLADLAVAELVDLRLGAGATSDAENA